MKFQFSLNHSASFLTLRLYWQAKIRILIGEGDKFLDFDWLILKLEFSQLAVQNFPELGIISRVSRFPLIPSSIFLAASHAKLFNNFYFFDFANFLSNQL